MKDFTAIAVSTVVSSLALLLVTAGVVSAAAGAL